MPANPAPNSGPTRRSKTLAISQLTDGPADGPGPFWFRLVGNRGGLMGLPLPSWLHLAGTVTVLAMALSALANNPPRHVILGWGILVGGAVGNLADRFQHRPSFPDHAVVDWVASPPLPTFNLADVAILVGRRLAVDCGLLPGYKPLRQPTGNRSALTLLSSTQ